MKPLVGITTSRNRVKVNHSIGQQISFVSNALVDIVVELGCVPMMLPIGVEAEDCSLIINHLDGLILGPGQDISAEFYGEKPLVEYRGDVSGLGDPFKRPLLLKPDTQRDMMERELYLAAKEKNIPILGICRGMQMINVVEGGTLYQEIATDNELEHNIEPDGWINYHEVEVVAGTKLHNLVRKTHFNISTIHHQGVDEIAESLIASAFTSDSMIEALESRNGDSLIIGIQGHIEKSFKHIPEIMSIWNGFEHAITTFRG